jgi:hypothetical protein
MGMPDQMEIQDIPLSNSYGQKRELVICIKSKSVEDERQLVRRNFMIKYIIHVSIQKAP